MVVYKWSMYYKSCTVCSHYWSIVITVVYNNGGLLVGCVSSQAQEFCASVGCWPVHVILGQFFGGAVGWWKPPWYKRIPWTRGMLLPSGCDTRSSEFTSKSPGSVHKLGEKCLHYILGWQLLWVPWRRSQPSDGGRGKESYWFSGSVSWRKTSYSQTDNIRNIHM